MDLPPLDLLIVGAGPGGLSTAVAAMHRGAKRVLVVDQARELRPIGQRLDILPNGVRFLSALSPAVRKGLEPYIYMKRPGEIRVRRMSADGHEFPSTDIDKYGELADILWWQLQKVLFESLPDRDVVLLNHQLVDIVHDADTGLPCAEFIVDRQRENKFKNWEGDYDKPEQETKRGRFNIPADEAVERGLTGGRRVKIRAKMIVGADGINSAVRRCIYRDCHAGWERFTDPVYSGMTRVACVAKDDFDLTNKDAVEIKNEFVKNCDICMLTCDKEHISPWSPRAFLLYPGDSAAKFGYPWRTTYFLPIDEDTVNKSNNQELAKVALGIITDAAYPPPLLRVSSQVWAESSEEDISVRRHFVVDATHPPPYQRPPTMRSVNYPEGFRRPWWYKRVVLVGDAAHAMPNMLAQGTSMAVEDAYVLVNMLVASGVWEKGDFVASDDDIARVLDAYYRERVERVVFVQKRTINRLSEFEGDELLRMLDKLYTYQPPSEADARQRVGILR